MVAKTKAQLPSADQRMIEKRRVARRLSGRSVVVKSSHGERSRAAIRDVSIYGCSLVCDATWLRMGSFVTIALSVERSIQAIVRWNRGGCSGVEFLRPISSDEAEEIIG